MQIKKEFSKFVCILLVVSLLGIGGGMKVSASEKEESVEITSSHELETSTNGTLAAGGLWRTVLKYGFKLLLNASSPKNVAPKVTHGSSRDTASSGTVSFNVKGKNEFNTVKKEVHGERVGHEIEMWANSGQLLKTGKLGVVLYDPKGISRINRSVGHNQYSWYKITSGKTGRYQAQYNTTSKHKWNLWIGYIHGGKGLKSTFTKVNEDNVEIEEFDFIDIGDKRYLVPSNEHLESTKTVQTMNMEESPISFFQLHNQFYDEKYNMLVDVAKDYNAGDTIYVQDTIIDLQYNIEEDYTELHFNNVEETVEAHFSGDLTNRFDIGDKLTFKFNLLSVSDEYDFVELDYNQQILENDEVPSIDEFLFK